MAYVPIADKSIGDVLPADDWNQLIENNAANPAGLAVARGDLFEGSAATTLRRIAIGASGGCCGRGPPATCTRLRW